MLLRCILGLPHSRGLEYFKNCTARVNLKKSTTENNVSKNLISLTNFLGNKSAKHASIANT